MTLETGQNVLLNVKEEIKQELEPVQTLLLHTEELTALETVLKLETVTHILARVRLLKLRRGIRQNLISKNFSVNLSICID